MPFGTILFVSRNQEIVETGQNAKNAVLSVKELSAGLKVISKSAKKKSICRLMFTPMQKLVSKN